MCVRSKFVLKKRLLYHTIIREYMELHQQVYSYISYIPKEFKLLFSAFMLLFLLGKYRYYHSPYYYCTRKLYGFLKKDKGAMGEYLIYQKLKSFPGKKYFFFNLLLPIGSADTEIDVVMIHSSGIYVFESKNYSGIIYGDEHSGNWCQFFNKSKKYSFYNPINQNHTHINALKKIAGKSFNFYNIVVFSDECDLKYGIKRDDLAVIQFKDLYKTCSSYRRKGRRNLNCEEIYNKLKPYMHSSRKQRRKHIKRIKKYIK